MHGRSLVDGLFFGHRVTLCFLGTKAFVGLTELKLKIYLWKRNKLVEFFIWLLFVETELIYDGSAGTVATTFFEITVLFLKTFPILFQLSDLLTKSVILVNLLALLAHVLEGVWMFEVSLAVTIALVAEGALIHNCIALGRHLMVVESYILLDHWTWCLINRQGSLPLH